MNKLGAFFFKLAKYIFAEVEQMTTSFYIISKDANICGYFLILPPKVAYSRKRKNSSKNFQKLKNAFKISLNMVYSETN